MLTPEQVESIRQRRGITPSAPVSSASVSQELDTAWGAGPTDTAKKEPTFFDRYMATSEAAGKKLGEIGAGAVKAITTSERKFGTTIGETIAAGDTIEGAQENKMKEQDMLMRVVKQIAENKKEGKDTSHLEWTLFKGTQNNPEIEAQIRAIVPSLDKTTKQVLGEAGGVLGDIVLAGGVPGLRPSKIASKGILAGIAEGAKEGAKVGAISGGFYGAAGAAQEDKPIGEIIGGAALGGTIGAAGGAILGGATGGFAGYANKKAAETATDHALKLTMPKKAPEGAKTTEPGVFTRSEVVPSRHDQIVAESVADVVAPPGGKPITSPHGAADAIEQKVSQTNLGVREMIAERKTPFNMKQLRSRLDAGKGDLKLVFTSDATAEKTYNAAADVFMDQVKDGDTLGLFDARQGFDQIPAIKKLLENDRLGENAKKQIVLAIRNAANEYIADQLPANNPYRATMRIESRMIEALENIIEKNRDTIGMNKLQIWTQKHPVLKWVVGGTAAGIAGGAGVGVGGAIIGSTD